MRRGPRSSIGNSKSVWLAHHSLVELMGKLGFPHYEILQDILSQPRVRTAFFRNAPRPVQKLGLVTRPLPLPDVDIVQKTRQRDIIYLTKARGPVTIIGRGPLLRAVVSDIKVNGISIDKTVELPDDYAGTNAMLREITQDRSVLAVPAVINVRALQLERFPGIEYVFSSFAVAARGAQKSRQT